MAGNSLLVGWEFCDGQGRLELAVLMPSTPSDVDGEVLLCCSWGNTQRVPVAVQEGERETVVNGKIWRRVHVANIGNLTGAWGQFSKENSGDQRAK